MGRKSRTRSTNEPRVVGARGEAQNHTHPQPSLGAPTAEANTNNAPTPNAEVTPTPTPGESLTKNKFCKGIKHGRRYVCSNETDDPETINKATELLTEAINRMFKWQVWDTWWINKHREEWLIIRKNIEERLRGKYSDEVINGITRLIDDFIKYIDKFKEYWLRSASNEIKTLINDLTSGKAEVIIWNNKRGISVHSNKITLNAEKTVPGGITVHSILKGLKRTIIYVPNIFLMTIGKNEYAKFVNEILKGLHKGFDETDGFTKDGKACMITTQTWQAVIWALLYYGKISICIDGIDINENGITIKWELKSNHNSLKGITPNSKELNKNTALATAFTAILGDGTARFFKTLRVYEIPEIRITMSSKKFKAWEPLLNKLWNMGFRWRRYPTECPTNCVYQIRFAGTNAVNLAKAIIANLPPILKDIMDALNPEKWINLEKIAEKKMKFEMGEMQIDVANIKFTLHVQDTTLRLIHYTNEEEINEVIKKLKSTYSDIEVKVNNSARRKAIVIPRYVLEKYNDIKEQVIEVLCRKLEKTKDEEKKQIITKHLRRLTPTKGTAAAQLTKTLKNTKHIPK